MPGEMPRPSLPLPHSTVPGTPPIRLQTCLSLRGGLGVGWVVIHEVSGPPRRIWAGRATSILKGEGARKDAVFPPPSLPSSC